MVLRVEVADPLPLFRRGVEAVVGELNHRVVVPEDLATWSQDRRVVLFTVLTRDDWSRLSRLCGEAEALDVIAVLAPYDMAGAVRAVTAGAIGVLPRDASVEETRAALTALVDGRVTLPLDVLRGLRGTATPEPGAALTAREIGWLRDLAQGATVARIASDAGYSERMMFRLLRDVYTRLGAESRAEALMAARDRGLV
jgi:DNA-binding NarL/FixJ family response regulator